MTEQFFNELVSGIYGKVQAAAMKGNRQHAEDATQIAILHAWKQWQGVPDNEVDVERFTARLCWAARMRSKGLSRRDRAAKRGGGEVVALVTEDQAVGASEVSIDMQEIIERLQSESGEIVTYLVRGCTAREIAAKTGEKYMRVCRKIYEIRRKLSAQLD